MQRHTSDLQVAKDIAHLNLYAEENGEPVLLTKDHILPVSLGGKDIYRNLQTLCAVCNMIRGNDSIPFNIIRKVRPIWIAGDKKQALKMAREMAHVQEAAA
jgi:5-methylcytosine-specific restriction endonuclease McrA